MFKEALAFNQNIGSWNVSKVSNMGQMFRGATAFNQPIGNWDVSKATDMSSMFRNASAFNQNIGSWNVAAVTTMASMFRSALAFNQNIGSWNIAAVTTMSSMFNGVTLTTANYDAILTGWAAQAVKPSVSFHGGSSKYSCSAAASRAVLTGAPNNWIITDGGADNLTSWDGSASSDWNTAANWSCNTVPNASSNVIINATVPSPVVDQAPATPAICNDLTINTGGLVSINPGKALTVNGAFTNNAGITGLMINSGGSLIQNSTAVAATVKRAIAGDNKFHLFISPINESVVADAASCFSGAYVDRYQESAGEWVRLATDDNVVSTYGYSVNFASGSPELTFPGTLKASPVSYTNLSYTSAAPGYGAGWNLAGNPYPCGINTALLTAPTGMNATAYVWDETGSGNYIPLTMGAASATPGIIAPMQGFFVNTSSATNSLVLANAAKVHGGTFYKSSKSIPQMLSLSISGNGYSDKTYVRFDEAATENFDQALDAYKLSGLDEAPQLYSILPGEKVAINTLPSLTANQYVPLGLRVGIETNYTLNVQGISSFDPSVPIILEDLKLSTSQDLRLNPVYSFTASPTDAENRFRLSFATVTGLNLPEASDIKISTKNGIIHVNCKGTISGKVYVYSTSGQLLATSVLVSGETMLRMASTGIYMVKVVSGKTSLTRKLVVLQ
jgi:surface protein